jgi:protein-S-isoprenylcysteine O-methyltransferase
MRRKTLVLNNIVQLVIALWVLSEILLSIFARARGGPGGSGDRVQDRASFFILYGGIFGGVALALLLTSQKWAHINLNFYLLNILALVFLLGGMAWRAWAIITLGRFFTTNVAVRTGHKVIRQGPYRWMRHPSYTGGLTSFFGLGLAFANWLSLAILMISLVIVYIYRMNVEEKTLITALGDEYLEYSRHTKRLIPGVY